MDGTAFVTQCPIVSGDSFLYSFDVKKQAGTFWYHSHFNLQYCDGLRGPIVIYDENDPYLDLYDVDDGMVFKLASSEWYSLGSFSFDDHHVDGLVSRVIGDLDYDVTNAFHRYHVTAYNVAAADSPAGILINGLGRYPAGPDVPLSVTTVEQGKRYRIRLINMACKPHILFSIEQHDFTVIEADGQTTLPLPVDQIPIYVGQRYSFILEANQPVDNYWIRALPQGYPSNFTNGLNSGILRYVGAPETEPENKTTPLVNPLVETNLHAYGDSLVPGLPFPGGADVSINLVSIMDNTTLLFYMNGETYKPPTTPILLQILSGALTASQLAPQGLVYTLPPNQVIEISIPTTFLPNPVSINICAFKGITEL